MSTANNNVNGIIDMPDIHVRRSTLSEVSFAAAITREAECCLRNMLVASVVLTMTGFSTANANELADEGWTAVPSTLFPAEATSVHYADPEKSKTHANTVGLRDQTLTLELKAAEKKKASPLIQEFGNQGSNVVQDTDRRSDAQLLNPDHAGDAVDNRQPSIAADLQQIQNLDMFVGELRVLGKIDVTRVAIGNGSIIRAEVLKTGELLVIGQNEGSTSLRLWNKDSTQTAYNIRVGANDPETRIRMERMVRLRVRMVEFRKRALGQLGIDWSDGTSGPTFAAAGDAIGNNLFRPTSEGFGTLPNQVAPFSTYFGITSNITSRINFLSQNGDAVTLAEPVLSAVSGGQASFLAGGEVPYPTIGANGQTTVEFKEYGVRLQIAPSIDAGGNVRTYVETEISQLDSAVSVNGAPGLLTRRAQTEVNVRSGQTIVISGLLSSESATDVQSVPGLGRLPIIGRFFSSTNKTNEVRELVIFVTPEVVEPEGALMSQTHQSIHEESSRRLEKHRQSLPLME